MPSVTKIGAQRVSKLSILSAILSKIWKIWDCQFFSIFFCLFEIVAWMNGNVTGGVMPGGFIRPFVSQLPGSWYSQYFVIFFFTSGTLVFYEPDLCWFDSSADLDGMACAGLDWLMDWMDWTGLVDEDLLDLLLAECVFCFFWCPFMGHVSFRIGRAEKLL